MADFIEADFIVKGPGVPPGNPYIVRAIEGGASVISDIEIFLKMTDCRIVAVTGSKGKSSTVSLMYSIFREHSQNTFLGGNITISPLSFYDKVNEDSTVILELSSWQLRDLRNKGFSFDIAVITNLMNDHQNYYSDMNQYLDDKKIITDNQGPEQFLIIPADDLYLNRDKIETDATIHYFSSDRCRNSSTFYLENGAGFSMLDGQCEKLFNRDDLSVPGEHIFTAALISAAAARLSGIDTDTIKRGLQKFSGVPFRLEKIKTHRGVTYINDTTATIPEAAASALRSFNSPIIWIGGGNDKNLKFECITEAARIPKKVYLLSGNGTDKMIKHIDRKIDKISDSLEELLRLAIENSNVGDIILLSPGCTSFGLFQNEFHRGRTFNELVEKMTNF